MRPPPPLAAPVASSRSPPPPFCPALRFPPPRFGRRAASQAIGQLPERRPIRIRLRLPRQRLSLGRPPLLHLLGTTLRVAADALAVSLTLARVPILGGHSRQRGGSRVLTHGLRPPPQPLVASRLTGRIHGLVVLAEELIALPLRKVLSCRRASRGFVSASWENLPQGRSQEVWFVGKASRQRQLKQDRERKQRRAAQPSASSPSGSSRPPHETQRHDVPPRPGHGTRRGIRPEPPSQAGQPSQRELAAAGVAEALDALAHGLQDQFLEWVEALAGQRQVPGWDATVSRELVSYLSVSVTGAWRHGWQPAEAVRHAGREKGDSHARMAADMIAGEMRGYAAATVDDRWLAQLSALRTEVWWGSDDAYLGRWRGREGD